MQQKGGKINLQEFTFVIGSERKVTSHIKVALFELLCILYKIIIIETLILYSISK